MLRARNPMLALGVRVALTFHTGPRGAPHATEYYQPMLMKAVARVIGRPSLPRLDVRPIVQSVIDAVESGGLLDNGALIRDAEDQLRIKLSVLIPADGPTATVRSRRQRFRTEIEKAMNAIGWELIAIIPALKFKKSGPKAAGELRIAGDRHEC
jgi:hypothetical protein